jgi:hypothetical protein
MDYLNYLFKPKLNNTNNIFCAANIIRNKFMYEKNNNDIPGFKIDENVVSFDITCILKIHSIKSSWLNYNSPSNYIKIHLDGVKLDNGWGVKQIPVNDTRDTVGIFIKSNGQFQYSSEYDFEFIYKIESMF